jgi:hypothetical protein
MVGSLFAYFFCMITAFSAITALLIGLFNNSTAENVLRYPRPQRPIIEQTAKKDEPDKNTNDSRVLFAKADIAKRKHEIENRPDRLSHLSKPKGLASQREKPKAFARQGNYERPNYYGNAPGYAEESRNGPQRLFSNW